MLSFKVFDAAGAGPAVRSSNVSSGSSSNAWESGDSLELYKTPETTDNSYEPPSSRHAQSKAEASGRRRR